MTHLGPVAMGWGAGEWDAGTDVVSASSAMSTPVTIGMATAEAANKDQMAAMQICMMWKSEVAGRRTRMRDEDGDQNQSTEAPRPRLHNSNALPAQILGRLSPERQWQPSASGVQIINPVIAHVNGVGSSPRFSNGDAIAAPDLSECLRRIGDPLSVCELCEKAFAGAKHVELIKQSIDQPLQLPKSCRIAIFDPPISSSKAPRNHSHSSPKAPQYPYLRIRSFLTPLTPICLSPLLTLSQSVP
jgi:hypothetical protein